MGLDPARQTYLNAYTDTEPPTLAEGAPARVRALADAGAEIVALGRAAHWERPTQPP